MSPSYLKFQALQLLKIIHFPWLWCLALVMLPHTTRP